MSTLQVALAGLSVRHGMVTDFKTVSPTDSLSRAVDLTLAGFQQDFPVMDGARLLGVLTHGDLLRGLTDHGTDLSVQQAMRGELETASPSQALDGALTRMHQGPAPPASRCRDHYLRSRGRARARGFDRLLGRHPRGRVPAHDRRARHSP